MLNAPGSVNVILEVQTHHKVIDMPGGGLLNIRLEARPSARCWEELGPDPEVSEGVALAPASAQASLTLGCFSSSLEQT